MENLEAVNQSGGSEVLQNILFGLFDPCKDDSEKVKNPCKGQTYSHHKCLTRL